MTSKTKITSEAYSNGISGLIGETVTNCLKGQDFDWDDCEKFLNLSFDYLITETNIFNWSKKDESFGELTVVHTVCDIEDNCYDGRGEKLSFSDLIISELKRHLENGDPVGERFISIKTSIEKSLSIAETWFAAQPAQETDDDCSEQESDR